MKQKEKESKYCLHRKTLFKEEMQLTYERTRINKQIRKVQEDMKAWDRTLLSEEV